MVETLSQRLEKYEGRKNYPDRPLIIQGGMGVAVSNWRLARSVGIAAEKLNMPFLGVVSGAGIEPIFARRLQDGDPETLRALDEFPIPRMIEGIKNDYVMNVKKPSTSRYRLTPKPTDVFSTDPDKRRRAIELTIVSNFVEIWLAKQGHHSPIGTNQLEKIQMLHPYRFYGAMLAGVNYILEGAGIPIQVPGVLDGLSQNKPVSYKVDVAGSKRKLEATFDPSEMAPEITYELKRPGFLAIIASNALAKVLTSTRVSGYVDGFVIEGPTAGGHNAPPRKKGEFNHRGEPVYGERDVVDLREIADLGRPFWLAGSYASPERIEEALTLGAAGVQVGTIFALSNESGIKPEEKQKIRAKAFRGELDIVTSEYASPTGFPFKVVQLEGTLSDPKVYNERQRSCDIGHLLEPYQARNGNVAFRCAAGPIAAYLQTTGKASLSELSEEDRKKIEQSACLCNGLAATAGFAQKDKHGEEPAIVTLGDRTDFIKNLIANENSGYSAYDAAKYLLSAILG